MKTESPQRPVRKWAGLAAVAAAASIALPLAGTAQASATTRQSNVTGDARPAAAWSNHLPARLTPFTFYSSSGLATVANGISGWSLPVYLEDNPADWAYYFGLSTLEAGFVCIYQTDPANFCYHDIFLGPVPTATFISWSNGISPSYWDAAVAIMTLTHEATHYKLFSSDEGRVNACALQEFPAVVDTYFGIHPTVTQTVAVNKTVYRTKKVWVRRNGRRVRITRRVRSVKVVYVEKSVANPVYATLIGAAQAFYNSQPPPYNSGTCY
jgi:hypothetical protein